MAFVVQTDKILIDAKKNLFDLCKICVLEEYKSQMHCNVQIYMSDIVDLLQQLQCEVDKPVPVKQDMDRLLDKMAICIECYEASINAMLLMDKEKEHEVDADEPGHKFDLMFQLDSVQDKEFCLLQQTKIALEDYQILQLCARDLLQEAKEEIRLVQEHAGQVVILLCSKDKKEGFQEYVQKILPLADKDNAFFLHEFVLQNCSWKDIENVYSSVKARHDFGIKYNPQMHVFGCYEEDADSSKSEEQGVQAECFYESDCETITNFDPEDLMSEFDPEDFL